MRPRGYTAQARCGLRAGTHPAAPDAPHFSVRTPVNSPSIVLAFDSSTEWLSVALDLGDGRVLQGTEPGGARASQRLLPLVGELLAQAGRTLAEVGLIGFGAGPGAFTGLRAACAAAQGLARGLRCPVVPVPTLLAVAAAAEPALRDGCVLAADDARMGELYWARAECAAGSWRLAGPSHVQSPRDAAACWRREFGDDPGALPLCGNAWVEHTQALGEALGAGWAAALSAARTVAPQAAAVAALARAAHVRGESVQAADARPLYVRDKVALTSDERARAKAAAAASKSPA